MTAPSSGGGQTVARTEDIGSVGVADVHRLLGSRVAGLSSEEVRERLTRHGPNVIEDDAASSVLPRLLAQFTHLMAGLLWLGGTLAFVAGLPQLGVAVWLVNLLNGAFSYWQEHRAERAVAALRRLLPRQARVVRDGVDQQVDAELLVPGDVLRIDAGDRISADARLVDEHELRIDQSALTGEQHPARRSALPQPPGPRPPAERSNVVFAGTTATSGRGTAVVFATGMDTEFGAIAGMTQSSAWGAPDVHAHPGIHSPSTGRRSRAGCS